MYKSNNINYYPYPSSGDRFAGGFLGPFLLGGITGGLLAPAFYPRPCPMPPPPPMPMPTQTVYTPYPVPVYYK